MITTIHYLYCTQCGKEYEEQDDSILELQLSAKKKGWTYERVENGSYWDFCPKCTPERDYNGNI